MVAKSVEPHRATLAGSMHVKSRQRHQMACMLPNFLMGFLSSGIAGAAVYITKAILSSGALHR